MIPLQITTSMCEVYMVRRTDSKTFKDIVGFQLLLCLRKLGKIQEFSRTFHRVATLFWGKKLKDFSRTSKHPHNLSSKLFHRKTAFMALYIITNVKVSKVTFFKQPIKSVTKTEVHRIAYSSTTTAPFFRQCRLLTILTFKHFQRPLKLNSKTFKYHICFEGLCRALKMDKNFPRLSRQSDPVFKGKPCLSRQSDHLFSRGSHAFQDRVTTCFQGVAMPFKTE